MYLAPLNPLSSHLSVKEPVPETVVNVFDLTVIIKVEDLTCIGPNPEVEAAYPERAAFRRDRGMRRTHVTRHPSAAGKIVPFGYFFNHAVSALLPGETVRAGRHFLTEGRLIEVDFDFLTDEMQSRITHFSRQISISFVIILLLLWSIMNLTPPFNPSLW